MFYTNTINIVGKTNGYVNDDGVWVDGTTGVIGSLECDIQPYNNELAFKQFGYEQNVSYKVYTPLSDDISLQTMVTLNDDDTEYEVVVCKRWDDYMILVLSDKQCQ